MPFRFLNTIFALSLLAVPTFSFALEARIAAIVDGEIITYYDLEQRAKADLREQNIEINNPSNQQQIKEIYAETLQTMISDEILLQAARAEGIRISDDVVSSEIEARASSIGVSVETYYQELEKAYGFSEDLIREETRKNLTQATLINRNVTSKVAVTEEEILEYYNEHKNSFGTKHNYHFALIMYPSNEEAMKFSTQLLDGAQGSSNFEAIAKQLSIGPNAENGGDMGTLEETDIASTLLYELQDMQTNEVSTIIDLSGTKAQVKLYEKSEMGADGVISEEIRAGIMELLNTPRVQARYEEYIAQLNKKAIIDVRYE